MKNEFVLSNRDLLDLRNDTPYAEGEPLLLFYPEVKAAADAIEKTGERPHDSRARVVQLVRAVYLLGVQRGAEAYRSYLLADADCEDVPEDMPFELSDFAEDTICDGLNTANPENLEVLYKMIGI